MKPKTFLKQVRDGKLAPGYLFVGPETFFRDRCRRALRDALFGGDREAETQGLVELDLRESRLTELLDETRTLSLFAGARLIIGRNAEAALPKGRTGGKSEGSTEFA